MASLIQQVQDALLADAALAVEHEGRVYDRPLKKAGTRATPEAWDADGRMRFNLVIGDEGDTADLQREGITFGALLVWIHGPDSSAAREKIRAEITPAVISVLTTTLFTGQDGTGAALELSDRFGLQDDPANADAVVDYVRMSVARLWRME